MDVLQFYVSHYKPNAFLQAAFTTEFAVCGLNHGSQVLCFPNGSLWTAQLFCRLALCFVVGPSY